VCVPPPAFVAWSEGSPLTVAGLDLGTITSYVAPFQ